MKANYHPAKFGDDNYSGSGVINNGFSLSRDQRVMRFYGWEPLIVSHHPAKFCGHRHCGSGDIAYVVVEG